MARGDIWIFGYGSLMWDPGFDYVERQPALLRGYHRAFCIVSHLYRGTPERPGLVLGLDRGGSCRGMAYRVAAEHAESVRAYLHEREMQHYVYVQKDVPVRLSQRTVLAQTHVADRRHERYCGKLGVEETARYIAQGEGNRGRNRDYLENTVRHLDELGIGDGPMHRLRDRVRELIGSGA